MNPWAKRRKIFYGATILILLVASITIPAFKLLYTPPNCFDGFLNGKEKGIDCGGSCQKICAGDFLKPAVGWTRYYEIAPGVYNVGAYIINANVDGEAFRVPYNLVLYDKEGVPISENKGIVTLAPHRNSLAFLSSIVVTKRLPYKAFFEFSGIPDWHKAMDPLSAIQIVDKKYEHSENSSSVIVTMKNISNKDIPRFSVSVVLYDINNNTLAFSKTFIDGIPSQSTATAPFTWPIDYGDKVISIEVLPVAE